MEKIKRPQKLRHGGAGNDEEDEAAKLKEMIAAEHLVGLSRTSGAESKSDKSETESTGEKED